MTRCNEDPFDFHKHVLYVLSWTPESGASNIRPNVSYTFYLEDQKYSESQTENENAVRVF